MFEFFEHTADVGFRVQDATLAGALIDAGRALSSLIVENLDEIRPAESVRIQVPNPPGGELDYLLFDWLTALLQEFESTGRVFSHFEVHVGDHGIDAECRGETLDPQRHRLGHEVKAITYHQLELRPTPDGFSGQVIVDL
ncbi:MAG: archease [Planctomycetaceae bacterium]